MIHILILFSFLLSSSHAAAKDFCVADLKASQGPGGYQCKVAEEVVVDDLVFSGLNMAGNFSDIRKSAINIASVDRFPGLNSLGLSMARLDLSGAIPMQSHPAASEVLLVTQGSICAGFISSASPAITKGLLQHFQVSSGLVPALVWSASVAQILACKSSQMHCLVTACLLN